MTALGLFAAPGLEGPAAQLAEAYGFSFAGVAEERRQLPEGYHLWLDGAGLALCAGGARAPGPVRCDFARLRPAAPAQGIARAVGARRGLAPTVADPTAGLGRDAFALASLGCRVAMAERHPVPHALLADGLARAARAEGAALRASVARLSLARAEGARWLASLAEPPDVVYLDPMFPGAALRGRSNKEMAALQAVVGESGDDPELFAAALAAARWRVVVKRPRRAPPLAGPAPTFSVQGRSVRFDVYARGGSPPRRSPRISS
ncbi:MAG: hypothetical protein KatS3mg124_0436 [Porticoccaceae bacterium]|nr:MAG: hypothetical protein KatS3mg124_0436 [Porticoccaceae bacterium]